MKPTPHPSRWRPARRPEPWRSSRRYLANLVVLVSILAVLAMGWVLADGRAAALERAGQAVENLAGVLARDMERIVGGQLLSMRALERRLAIPGIEDMPEEIRQAILFDGDARAPHSGRIGLIGPDGQARHGSVAGTEGRDFSDREFFTAPQDRPGDAPHVSRSYIGPESGQASFALSLRQEAAEGGFGGVIVGTIRLAALDALVRQIDLGADGVITLLRGDGHVLYRSNVQVEQLPQLRPIRLGLHGPPAERGVFQTRSQFDGRQRLTAYVRLGDVPLTIAVSTSVDTILAAWQGKALIEGSVMLLLMGSTYLLVREQRREIKQRGRAEAAARQAVAESRIHFEHAPDMVLEFDLPPQAEPMLVRLNPAASFALGLEDAGGQPALPPALLAGLLPRLRLVVEAGQPLRFDLPMKLPDGPVTWHVVLAAVAQPNRPGHLAMVLARDVTRQRQRDAQARLAEKQAAMGRLTGGIAHDFNNLLQALSGSLELLRAQVEDQPELLELVETGQRAASRSSELVQQLLAFAGRQVLRPESLAARSWLEAMARRLDRECGEAHDIIASAEDDCRLHVDPVRLEQALRQLTRNACAAMPEGGEVRLRAAMADPADPHWPPRLSRKRDFVELSVGDSGLGIEPALLPELGTPFLTTRPLGKGSGLGLAMAKGFAQQSGGDLVITSMPGRGTQVRLFLPAEAAMARETARPRAARRGTRVLLVEDHPHVRDTLVRLMEDSGMQVTAVADPAAGIAACDVADDADELPEFDIVVTDLQLPGMDGAQMLRRIWRTHPAMAAMIVTSTPSGTQMQVGARRVPVLRKPFNRVAFLTGIAVETARAERAWTATRHPEAEISLI